jgi:vacuolar protein sorting-associated protein 3
MGNHRDALQILVHELKDAVSAEIYCTLGGEVIPIKVARSIGDSYGLQQWAATLFGSTGVVAKSGTRPQPIARQKTVSEDAKKELLKVLLEVYMSAECGTF